MNRLCTSLAILCSLLIAALSGSCVGSEPPALSTTTVTPPPSLAVDPCPLNVTGEAVTVDVPFSGGSRTLDVITGATCDWTAKSQSPFITITTDKTGRGSGTVTLNVERNTGAQRSGEVVVNQLTVTVSQAAAPCEFALSPESFAFDKDGGTGTVAVTVTQGADCQWSAQSIASFVVVTSGSSGTGNGSVTFRVESNPAEAPRNGTLSIAGATVVVNQGARSPDPPTTYVLSVGGYQQPWCASSFAIQSTPGPNFPPYSAPGSFTHTARALAHGTVVELRGSGGGSVLEWSDCDEGEFEAGVCQVTMNGNRSPRASIAQSCATPSFSAVSANNVSGTWTVSFTAINLVPFAGTAFGGVTFTASCMGFTTSTTLPSQASGTVSGTITVPVVSCPSGGVLSLSDFNGSAQTSW
jgi:hypothetical protein